MARIRAALVLSAIAASGITYARYSREIRAARERVSLGGNVINTACGPIHFADVGQGKPLLLIHGAGGGFDQGLLIAKQNGISKHDYRIIAPSRFGYLQTPLPPEDASPAAQANAHACLLDALGVRERVAVMGTSAGALSAMQFAIKYPGRVSALVLQVPDSWAPPESRGAAAAEIAGSQFILNVVLRLEFIMWAFMKLAKGSMLVFMGVPKELQDRATQGELDDAEELMRTMLPVSQRHEGIRQDAINSSSLERYALEDIHAPTLIIDAKDVTSFPGSQYTAEHIPNARLIAFEQGGHLLIGHGSETSMAIREFLRQHHDGGNVR